MILDFSERSGDPKGGIVMIKKWVRRICLAAIAAAITAGISHQIIVSDEHPSQSNAVLVMAQQEVSYGE